MKIKKVEMDADPQVFNPDKDYWSMDNGYTLKTWETPTSQPEIRTHVDFGFRTSLSYSFAYSMATKGGHYKAQVICQRWDTIELEVKNDPDLQ